EETFQTAPDLRHLSDAAWQPIFKKYDISHLIIDTAHMVSRPDPSDPRRIRRVNEPLVDLMLLDRDPKTGRNKWDLLRYTDGRTAVVAWTGSPHWGTPENPGPLQKLRYDAVQEAFRTPPPIGPEVPAKDATQSASALGWLTSEIRQPPLAFEEARWHIGR